MPHGTGFTPGKLGEAKEMSIHTLEDTTLLTFSVKDMSYIIIHVIVHFIATLKHPINISLQHPVNFTSINLRP